MATTEHPLVLDLGKVVPDFDAQAVLDHISKSELIDKVPTQGSTRLVESGGVYDAINNRHSVTGTVPTFSDLGAIDAAVGECYLVEDTSTFYLFDGDDWREVKSGSIIHSKLDHPDDYPVTSAGVKEAIDALADAIAAATDDSNNIVYLTLAAATTQNGEAGKIYFVDNGGANGNALTFVLPDTPDEGAQIFAYMRATGSSSTSCSLSVTRPSDSSNTICASATTASGTYAIVMRARFLQNTWFVELVGLNATVGASYTTYRITYSGANRAATNGKTYTQTVVSGVATKLRTDVFKSLYGMTLKGWTTSQTGTSVVYTPGQSVTSTANRTLYPLYTAKNVTGLSQSNTSGSKTIPDHTSAMQTVDVKLTASPASGYCESTLEVKVYAKASTTNSVYSDEYLKAKIGSTYIFSSYGSGAALSKDGSLTVTLSKNSSGEYTTTVRFEIRFYANYAKTASYNAKITEIHYK